MNDPNLPQTDGTLFFLPRGSRSGNGRTETLDALHAIGANVLKPYVGDVEGKDVRSSTAPTAEHVAWWRPSSWWGAEDVVTIYLERCTQLPSSATAPTWV